MKCPQALYLNGCGASQGDAQEEKRRPSRYGLRVLHGAQLCVPPSLANSLVQNLRRCASFKGQALDRAGDADRGVLSMREVREQCVKILPIPVQCCAISI